MIHHQPINAPTAGAQTLPMDGIGSLDHDPPRRPSADWRVLTTADAAGTNGLTVEKLRSQVSAQEAAAAETEAEVAARLQSAATLQHHQHELQQQEAAARQTGEALAAQLSRAVLTVRQRAMLYAIELEMMRYARELRSPALPIEGNCKCSLQYVSTATTQIARRTDGRWSAKILECYPRTERQLRQIVLSLFIFCVEPTKISKMHHSMDTCPLIPTDMTREKMEKWAAAQARGEKIDIDVYGKPTEKQIRELENIRSLSRELQDNLHGFPMDGIGILGHDPPGGPSADWWVLTTADAAGTNGLTCLPKHGGARDRSQEKG
ncbi:hypothetical protein evm_012203 [Chilo suppressalis]|nr:hypothetical protein evm_012203 [Chilo suppressalis]